MITLYGMPKTRSMRAVWALEEIGVEYQFIPVDLVKGEGRTPEFLALNPGGKVPVLVDGDLVLTESAAICTYLGDRFPETNLVPRCGSAERGLYDQWCYFVMTELEQPLWTIGKHKFALPEEKRVPEIKDTAIWEFQRAAALLASGLGDKQYLLGDHFTMADLLAAHTLGWARSARIPHNIELLEDYRQRMMSREAFQRTLAAEKG